MSTVQERVVEFFALQGHGYEEYQQTHCKSEEEEADCFMGDLSFGTAGLRAEMDVGFNRMNAVTVRIASMGIAAYLREKSGSSVVVIGHDHRHNSELFARSAAQVYCAYGHKVRLFPRIVPTPFVPSAIQCLKTVGLGVMVTASHNPKRDNGYKVYGGNGAQIGDQVAKEISEFIKKERGNYKNVCGETVKSDGELLEVVEEWYIDNLKGFMANFKKDPCCSRRVVYTALHGVGAEYVERIFASIFGSNCDCVLLPVPEQRHPDPDFPTVDFPNPEEGPTTLSLAIKYADTEDVGYIFANDPDADRFCVAEKCEDGQWRIFNGNEIAVLLGDFIAGAFEGEEKCAMLASCVSSRFLAEFCKRRGWRFESTLTGFKNLGNRGMELKTFGYKVLLAYEEAIGFQVGDWNFDKDGISALIVFYALLSDNTISLSERLKTIYGREECWPAQCNGYYFCKPASKIKPILQSIDPDAIQKRRFKNENGVVTVEFDVDGFGSAWLMLRSSGTEPKLKYYSELMGVVDDGRAGEALETAVDGLIEAMIQPDLNNLVKKK